jgi:uncharacterized protein (TIGR02246 family)
MRGSSLVLVVALLGACSSTRRGEDLDGAVREAVETAWREHIDAARRKDAERVAAIYAEDAIYAVAGAPEVRGRAALERMEVEGLAAGDVIEATHTTHELRVFGDVAYEIGTIEGPVQARGEPAPRVVTFHFMGQWARQSDGTWRLRHLVGRM